MGRCKPSANVVHRSALPSSLASSKIKTLSFGLRPGQVHRVRRHGADPHPPPGVERHADRVLEIGELDLGREQVDRVAFGERERFLFLGGRCDVDWRLDVAVDLDELAGSAIVDRGRDALALAIAQIRSSRFLIIVRRRAISAGKLMMPKGAFRPPKM